MLGQLLLQFLLLLGKFRNSRAGLLAALAGALAGSAALAGLILLSGLIALALALILTLTLVLSLALVLSLTLRLILMLTGFLALALIRLALVMGVGLLHGSFGLLHRLLRLS